MDSTRIEGLGDIPHAAAKKPWVAPQVILSNPLSAARVDNKGQNVTPDNRYLHLTSTSTS
jgi:hypothetical protein